MGAHVHTDQTEADETVHMQIGGRSKHSSRSVESRAVQKDWVTKRGEEKGKKKKKSQKEDTKRRQGSATNRGGSGYPGHGPPTHG